MYSIYLLTGPKFPNVVGSSTTYIPLPFLLSAELVDGIKISPFASSYSSPDNPSASSKDGDGLRLTNSRNWVPTFWSWNKFQCRDLLKIFIIYNIHLGRHLCGICRGNLEENHRNDSSIHLSDSFLFASKDQPGFEVGTFEPKIISSWFIVHIRNGGIKTYREKSNIQVLCAISSLQISSNICVVVLHDSHYNIACRNAFSSLSFLIRRKLIKIQNSN
jgi:hypothetical protein